MKFEDLLKLGFWGVVAYHVSKELNKPTGGGKLYAPSPKPGFNWKRLTDNPHLPPPPRVPLSLDVNKIVENVLKNDLDRLRTQEKITNGASSPEALGIITPLDPDAIEAENWRKLIKHPSVVVIIGGRGKGKSALGYRLLEHFRWKENIYVVGLPKEGKHFLPEWIGVATTLEEVPPSSVVLVDEGYLNFHARRSMTTASITMSKILNLSRQRGQTLIFISQESRQIDRNITSSASVVVFKDLGILQLEFDRLELNKIATQAKQAFASVIGDKKRWSYVYSPDADFMGLVENKLATFWSEKLSCIFSISSEAIARPPKKTPLDQRIQRAKELKRQGFSNGRIAKMMGVSKGTIKNWLDDFPYKPHD